MLDPCFISLKSKTSNASTFVVKEDDLPDRFPYPFCYTPDPIAIQAAQDLQHFLENSTEQAHTWRHNFGDIKTNTGDAINIGNAPELPAIGKMFGVLVVKNSAGELGYLAGFSGKLAEQNHWPLFVPPIFDTLKPQGEFLQTTDIINDINHQIKNLENTDELKALTQQPNKIKAQAEQDIETSRLAMVEAKKQRKLTRQQADNDLAAQDISNEQHAQIMVQLAQQSVTAKQVQQQLKQTWQQAIDQAKQELKPLEDKIEDLKQQRKNLSNQLQQWLFDQYHALNKHQQTKTLTQIFKPALPPAGSGECAAPKLLNHAFLNGYTPITMAEFWWGASPSSEIRQHKTYYPACQNKCQPILSHMLEGIELQDNPLLQNPAEGKEFEIIYQDEAIVVVNKPAEFLSVPGVHIKDSVFTRLQAQFGHSNIEPDLSTNNHSSTNAEFKTNNNNEGPFVVHRLDMSTSGLLVFALTKRANKSLQKQFITRQVKKRYIAVLDGDLDHLINIQNTSQDNGKIDLPLMPDITERPRQKVCYDDGKPALTHWQIIGHYKDKTKLYLYPQTGRTHQLRVHCAHSLGLNCAILGDDLYGRSDERLCLHAEQLSFEHPYTKEKMTFVAPDPFI